MRNILYFIFVLPIFAIGQTQTENYIMTTAYKGQNGTLPEVSITYFDALGRPIQQIANAKSASGKDIVTHMEYDALGRMPKEFLPYATTSTSLNYNSSAGTEVGSYYNTAVYENTLNPYSQKEYEASPLNRVLKQGNAGNPWAMGSGHEVKMDYQSNNDSDAVKYFKAIATWNASAGLYDISITNPKNYDANELYKTVVKNENWTTGNNNTSQEFKDKEGKIVLKRTFNEGQAYDTYFVYDQFGNQTYVIPPLAEGSISPADLDGLCYQYKYDYRNRLVEKKLPGKQWEFFLYDKLDRLVATGPALSPFTDLSGNGWIVTKYDRFNRSILTGWMSATIDSPLRKTQQDALNATTIMSESKVTATSSIVNGVDFKYSNTSWPTSGYHVLTVNYYDDYNFPNAPTIPATIEAQAVYYNTTIKPKSFATGSYVRVPETSTLFKAENSYILYDKKSRPVRTYSQNHLGGYTQVDSKFDFIGKIEYTLTTHKRSASDAVLTIKDIYQYSAQDRLILHKQQINALPEQLIVKNTYDELGQLVSKNVGGTDTTGALGLQKVDYSYNIRGWLKGINDTTNLTQGANPQDLFSLKLGYNLPDGATPLFNGNISETLWRTSSDNVLRKYRYSYDNLNRLTWAGYQKPEMAAGKTPNYDEGLSYDKNGNITSLIRNGDLDSDGLVMANMIDDLAYTYHPSNKNQLMRVFDGTNNPQGFKDDTAGISDPVDDYSYDDYGNMTKDDNKGITGITYNHLNLPTKIFFGTNTIEYLYNAAGQKLQKKVTEAATITTNGTNTTVEYLSGFQYKDLTLQFFPHAEGYVNNVAGTYSYVFNYTDHLGNVRMSYAKDATTGSLKILEENHYYAFGMKHTNYNSDVKLLIKEASLVKIKPAPAGKPLEFKYKYNAKEYQDELGLNFYDYGARNYDPAIGRWMNIDPLAEKFSNTSGYVYALNNPIFFIDPDGMDVVNSPFSNLAKSLDGDYFDTNGNYLGSDDIDDKKIYIVSKGLAVYSPFNQEYSRDNLPKGFYDKNQRVNRQVAQANSKEITKVSGHVRLNAAEGILSHYYGASGYDISELKYKTISDTPATADAVARTRYGGVTPFSDDLKAGEMDIQVSYGHVGNKLQTGYDIINLFSHERGKHMSDCIKFGSKMYQMDPEYRAYLYQIQHSTWRNVSNAWYNHVKYNGSTYLYPSEVLKYFTK